MSLISRHVLSGRASAHAAIAELEPGETFVSDTSNTLNLNLLGWLGYNFQIKNALESGVIEHVSSLIPPGQVGSIGVATEILYKRT